MKLHPGKKIGCLTKKTRDSMNEGKPGSVMADFNNVNGSQRRRSARLSSSPPAANVNAEKKMATVRVAVKRSITVRKIAPRKTVAPSDHDKENTPLRSGCEVGEKTNTNVSTPGPNQASKKKEEKKKAAMPSPILPPSSPAPACPQQPGFDARDAEWSQKARRSYSRISDKSFNSPDSRDNLFGFEKLKTPEVIHRVAPSKIQVLEVSGSGCGSSFMSLLEAEDRGSVFPEPDTNIPGVCVEVKDKRRRRRNKVQNIDATELDAMAAKMNAEFEEAEEFELIVE